LKKSPLKNNRPHNADANDLCFLRIDFFAPLGDTGALTNQTEKLKLFSVCAFPISVELYNALRKFMSNLSVNHLVNRFISKLVWLSSRVLEKKIFYLMNLIEEKNSHKSYTTAINDVLRREQALKMWSNNAIKEIYGTSRLILSLLHKNSNAVFSIEYQKEVELMSTDNLDTLKQNIEKVSDFMNFEIAIMECLDY
jgi:hypothetical protein